MLKLPGQNIDVLQLVGGAPDYPVSQQSTVDAVLLLPITTKAAINDTIEIAELQLKIVGLSASYDSIGKLANYVVEAMLCDPR